MKKILGLFLSVVMFMSCLHVYTFASLDTSEYETTSSIAYLEDGSYIVTTIIEDICISRASGTKSGKKTMIHYSSDNEVQWSATVKGTFSYNGSYATCTSASISSSISNSNWKISSATATATGNKAIGNVTAKRYFLGVSVQTVEKSVTLSCSANGALS